jgi:hypothetical protein
VISNQVKGECQSFKDVPVGLFGCLVMSVILFEPKAKAISQNSRRAVCEE